MWHESEEAKKGASPPALRTGLTTGSCATACCVAAATYLLAEKFSPESPPKSPQVISITLPTRKEKKSKTVELSIINYEAIESGVRTSTIKDAGDDPDATHGATVFIELGLNTSRGVQFKAAVGVGTVTKEGLLLAVGEPAINPVPRQMMVEHLERLAEEYQYEGGFSVAVGVENGEAIAQKTMNPRLGIVGGLSILGTTGIVRPFSCAAWIASIYQGIDVAEANGCTHIAATTGNRSEETIQEHYQLDDTALIEMGDFAGAVLKHLKKLAVEKLSEKPLAATNMPLATNKNSLATKNKPLGIKKLSICGGFGKISKLAQGHMDLNSRASSIDFDYLVSVAKSLGATDALCKKIQGSNTSIEALKHCQDKKIDLALALCQRALTVAQNIVPDEIDVEVMAIDRHGKFVASTSASVMRDNY
ncbi:MAG: cobalt-precorrin-5B (C1)-methyltransferase [Cellvibrionaceae bacterium]|jgi:cobalt-precorrin-5B (C1)-methyltransferase